VRRTPASLGRLLLVITLLVVPLGLLTAALVLRWAPVVNRDSALEGGAHRLVLADPALRVAVQVVTGLGGPVAMDVVAGLLVVGLLVARRVRAAVYVAAVRLVELAVETGLKNAIARPRPAWSDPVAHAAGFSYPSGHGAGSAAMWTVVLVLVARAAEGPARTRAVGAVAVLGGAFVIGVAASRVLLGVHYPSDVVAGVLLGTACALLLSPILTDPRVAADPSAPTDDLRRRDDADDPRDAHEARPP
jgi:undecaprenyl-diphosphatase